ncbi:MAG: ATP-binding protein [Candidatus Omnitrophica bacterium]|nr:ATP-binding protein [Candidatus Omnitrophota bacterium]
MSPLTTTTIIDEKIPSRLNLVSGFIAAVVRKLENLKLAEEVVFDLKLCLHEALVNAVKHGNKHHEHLTVHVLIKADHHQLLMEVTDQGEGFDAAAIPNPTADENIMASHGRGIHLIKSMMDKVTFLNDGRTVRMLKVFKGGS